MVQPLPSLIDNMELQVTPESDLVANNNASGKVQMPTCEDCLKLFSIIHQQFPEFCIEDKVNLLEGSIVMPPINIVYSRSSMGPT